MPLTRRAFAALLLALAGTVWLGGCAGLGQLRADIATYGDWPAGRAPGRYAFDRLPSQQARAQAQQRLEDGAAAALLQHGFRPAAAGEEPDVLVQLGARVTRSDSSPWDDPLWWRGGFGSWRHGAWPGPAWGLWVRQEPPRYEREVALLLRDRASGKPLYEARASSDGPSAGGPEVLAAMFRAALADFPRSGANPREVTVPLGPP
jgi:Domain of unknown function (DUF4136)